MIKYNTTELKIKHGTLNFPVFAKEQLIRHYPGTDISTVSVLGRSPTKITCTLQVESETDLVVILGLLHSTAPSDLQLGDMLFKETVINGGTPRLVSSLTKAVWNIPVEFVALDPIPYNVTTGVALYA
jgi:hypothetical protein